MADDNNYEPSENCTICHPNLLTSEIWHVKMNDVEDIEFVSSDDESSTDESSSDDEPISDSSGLDSDEEEGVTSDKKSTDNLDKHTYKMISTDDRNKREIFKKSRPRAVKYKQGNRVSGQIITMPTGKRFWMPTPATPKFICGNKTQLISLSKFHRSRGRREYDIIEQEMQNTIVPTENCENLGGCFEKYDVIKIQRIVQGCVWRRYQNRKIDVGIENDGEANERMLFHGSDAVWSIVKTGFDERFASTNGQFGAGLYFGDRSSLCNQFVYGYFGGNGCPRHKDKNCYICERHLLLCRVILGNSEKMSFALNMPHPPKYKHSIEATVCPGGFLYPEYVVYRGEQVYPEYLITYKIVKPRNFTPQQSDN